MFESQAWFGFNVRVRPVFLLCAVGFWFPALMAASPLDGWPQWRGPLATGVAPRADPPVTWSETNNIRWKRLLPGKGHSTPIIWGDRLFLTAAVPFGESVDPVYDQAPGSHDNLPVSQRHRFVVLALSRASGETLWERTVHETFPHEGGHETGSLASNSAVTDGELVFAFFGSHGLHCLNFEGELKWSKDLGRMTTLHAHGEGSSPALDGDFLVVNWDHEGDSMLYAFDKRTGEELWRTSRDEETSWSTPLIVEHAGKKQVVVSATKRVRGYDLDTGKVIWECGGLARNVVATPVAGEGIVIAANSYDWQAMLAIRLENAQGDITGSDRVAWKLNRLTPSVPSPLLYGETLYFLRHNQNILSGLRLTTGEPRSEPMRLPGLRNIFASPVGAADRIYIVDREGAGLVVSHAAEPAVLAVNRLADSFSASPAVAGRELYLRGERALYCIAAMQ